MRVNRSLLITFLLLPASLFSEPSEGNAAARPASAASKLKAAPKITEIREVNGKLVPARGHSLDSVMDAIFSLGVNRAKGEFETTAQFEAKFETATKRFMQSVPVLYIELGNTASISYDADTETLTASVLTLTREYDDKTWSALVLSSVPEKTTSYVAQNAFGAKFVVKEISAAQTGLLLTAKWDEEKSVTMPPDEARRLKPRLRALLKCRLNEAYVHGVDYYSKATFANPVELSASGCFIFVEPLELILVDGLTGQILGASAEQ